MSIWLGARDGITNAGPVKLEPSCKANVQDFLMEQKRLANRGRCLHYEGGDRCQNFVNSHSIQKNRMLSQVAHDGHVYKASANFRTLKKHGGKITYELCGINKMSTFMGFCGKHDNELFEPIDNFPLYPTDHQVFLYGYRSLCRELFLKENALDVIGGQVSDMPEENAVKDLMENMAVGTAFGFQNLKEHKAIYDDSLRTKSYQDIRYVLFSSPQNPFVAFSGAFYPDYDFIGGQLQNLGDRENRLDLIAFCSTPMSFGWGFLFSWHKSRSKTCTEFMRSLVTAIHEGSKPGDVLFGMVISACENVAISPEWWDQFPVNYRNQIESCACLGADVFSITKPTYLMKGLEGIVSWEFDQVISKME